MFQYWRRQWVLVFSVPRNEGCLHFCAPVGPYVFYHPRWAHKSKQPPFRRIGKTNTHCRRQYWNIEIPILGFQKTQYWGKMFQYGRRQWVLVFPIPRNEGCLHFCAPVGPCVFYHPHWAHKSKQPSFRGIGKTNTHCRRQYWNIEILILGFWETSNLCPWSGQTRPQPAFARCSKGGRR
jgi:hypothetical protein